MRQGNKSLGAVAYDQLIQVDPTVVPTFGKRGSIAKKITAPAGLFLKLDDGENVNWTQLATSSAMMSPTVEQWVDSVNGSDITGNGTLEQPFQTIQACVDNIIDATALKPYLIRVMPGDYPEVVTWKDFISLEGAGPGNVNIQELNYTTGAGLSPQVGISGCFVPLSNIDMSAGAGGSVILTNVGLSDLTYVGSVASVLVVQGGLGLLDHTGGALTLLIQCIFQADLTIHPGSNVVINGGVNTGMNIELEGSAILGTGNLIQAGAFTVNGTIVGIDTPTWRTDALSIFSSITGAITRLDQDKFLPAVPGDWAPPPTLIFEALDQLAAKPVGEVNTASNLGAGDGVFAAKVLADLQFKSLVAGPNITLTPSPTEIQIEGPAPGEVNTASNLGAGAGVFAAKVLADLQFKSLVAGTNITLTPTANDITIDALGGGSGFPDNIYTVHPTGGDYTDIPAAVTQALADGRNANNPAIILVFPQAAAYGSGATILMPEAGIHLVAFEMDDPDLRVRTSDVIVYQVGLFTTGGAGVNVSYIKGITFIPNSSSESINILSDATISFRHIMESVTIVDGNLASVAAQVYRVGEGLTEVYARKCRFQNEASTGQAVYFGGTLAEFNECSFAMASQNSGACFNVADTAVLAVIFRDCQFVRIPSGNGNFTSCLIVTSVNTPTVSFYGCRLRNTPGGPAGSGRIIFPVNACTINMIHSELNLGANAQYIITGTATLNYAYNAFVAGVDYQNTVTINSLEGTLNPIA